MGEPIIAVAAEEGEKLFSAIAVALMKWTRVELNVNLVFGLLCRIPDNRRVGAITDGIVSFPIRLSLCDRLLALEGLPELETEMWTRLSAKISKHYKKRHEIAHFNILASPRAGGLAEPMLSPFFSYEKWMTQTAKYLSLDQVIERGETFEELASAVHWFLTLIAHGMLPEKCPKPSSEEPLLIPRIRASAVQILEERQQSSQ